MPPCAYADALDNDDSIVPFWCANTNDTMSIFGLWKDTSSGCRARQQCSGHEMRGIRSNGPFAVLSKWAALNALDCRSPRAGIARLTHMITKQNGFRVISEPTRLSERAKADGRLSRAHAEKMPPGRSSVGSSTLASALRRRNYRKAGGVGPPIHPRRKRQQPPCAADEAPPAPQGNKGVRKEARNRAPPAPPKLEPYFTRDDTRRPLV
jgi:hypothetical protein